MVEYSLQLDSIFGSLSDPTRRDILQRVSKAELSVGEIAEAYDLTLAAISKHLKVLEQAALIIKRRQGKQQFVQAAPETIGNATQYLEQYRQLWESHMDQLEEYLRKEI